MSDDPVADRMGLAADPDAPSSTDDPVAARMYAASVHGTTSETHASEESRNLLAKTLDYFPGLGATVHAASGMGASARAGLRSIYDLATGVPLSEVDKKNQQTIEQGTYSPAAATPADYGSRALESNWNPLNWPGLATDALGRGINKVTGGTVAGPVTAGALDVGLGAAGLLEGRVGGWKRPIKSRIPDAVTPPAPEPAPSLSTTGAPRAGYWEPTADSKPPAFAESAPVAESGSALPDAEQAHRKEILKRVGVTETRQSAIEGDAQTAANEYQTSKLNSPVGARMKAVLDGERQALEHHADSIVEGTGGTQGSAADETVRLERGNNILAPLDDLKKHFDDATTALYKEATERARGKPPAALSDFQDLLNDDSEMTNSDRVNLRTGLNAYLKKLKIVQEDGSIAANPEQAETVRKYLNEQWSPQNSRYVGKLKDAIDDGVMKAAGEDVYGAARQMRATRARTLDDPDGISKLMDSSGPQGVNRSVPVERVADSLTTMPVAQLQHIVQTLKNMPEELQPQAQTALAEIRAHMASKVADAGKSTQSMWNAKGVSQALTKNSARMKLLFSPEELARFGDLNDAGNILKKDQSYPGAAVQEHNLVRAGAMAGVRAAGAGAGAVVGGAFGVPGTGAAAGAALADKIGGKFSEARALKKANQQIVDLTH